MVGNTWKPQTAELPVLFTGESPNKTFPGLTSPHPPVTDETQIEQQARVRLHLEI